MISTSGDYSDGIFAQSVGGGGGKGTSAKGIEALSGAGASGGFGASVSVDAATGPTVARLHLNFSANGGSFTRVESLAVCIGEPQVLIVDDVFEFFTGFKMRDMLARQ